MILTKKCDIDVTLVSRNEENLKNGINLLKDYAQNIGSETSISYNVCDIAKGEREINEWYHQIIRDKTPVDILINSAGITYNKLLASSSTESIKNVLDVNLLGTILITKYVAKQMIKQKHGSIINIGILYESSVIEWLLIISIFRRKHCWDEWKHWTNNLCCF